MSRGLVAFGKTNVGLTKSALKKTLGRTPATLESLQTIIVKVEALLNDHTLTYASSDIKDPESVTPAHLLYERRIIPLPHCMIKDEIDGPDFGDA